MNNTTIIWTLFGLIILFGLVYMAHLSKGNKEAVMVDGKLPVCPDKSNCINTEYIQSISHYLPPLDFSIVKSEQIILLSKEIILQMGGEIVVEKENYLAAKFTSTFFGFVDDFEIRRCDKQNKLHIRSASRLGYYDFGVNKSRVERFSTSFKVRIE